MNLLHGLFYLVLCIDQLNNVFSEVESTNIDCKIKKGYQGAKLHCVIPRDAPGLLLTEDFLKRMVIYNEETTTNCTLNDYPRAITTFSMDLGRLVRGNVTVKENALKALANVTTLSISGASRSPTIVLPSGELRNTPNLTRLFFTNVSVVGNTIDFVCAAPALKSIHIFYVRINSLKSNTFCGMVHLKDLRLRNNDLDNIEHGTFDGLNELEIFAVTGNNINILERGLPKDSKKLSKINLYNTSITTVQKSSFKTYTNLTFITLSSNPITNIEAGAFDDQENLTGLSLTSSPINNLPEGLFQKTKSLTILRLTNTQIRRINSTTFKGLRNLQDLSLDESKLLTTIETGAFDDLVNLTHLYMRNIPNLITLPDGLFKNMKKLHTIDFLKTYPQNLMLGNFSHCPDLDTVWMRDDGPMFVIHPHDSISCEVVQLPVNDSHQLTCSTLWDWSAILTPRTMRQVVICYDDVQSCTIAQYPGEITTLIIRGKGSLTIAENTMELFPNLTRLQISLVMVRLANLTIPADEFRHTPYLRNVLVERFDLANSTKQAIQSVNDRNIE